MLSGEAAKKEEKYPTISQNGTPFTYCFALSNPTLLHNRVESRKQTYYVLNKITVEDGAVMEEVESLGFSGMDANHNTINGGVVFAVSSHSRNLSARRIALVVASAENQINTIATKNAIDTACKRLFAKEETDCEWYITDDGPGVSILEDEEDTERASCGVHLYTVL